MERAFSQMPGRQNVMRPSLRTGAEVHRVDIAHWLSEGSLFLVWYATGDAFATYGTSLLLVDSSVFAAEVLAIQKRSPTLRSMRTIFRAALPVLLELLVAQTSSSACISRVDCFTINYALLFQPFYL